MTPDEYQRLASRTECNQFASRHRMMGPNDDQLNLLLPIRVNHAALGCAGESGELCAAVQRWIYYGKVIDLTNIKEELGDLMWYIAEACNALGFSLEDVMKSNIAKLTVRYPEKYTDQHASEENRNRVAESKALNKE